MLLFSFDFRWFRFELGFYVEETAKVPKFQRNNILLSILVDDSDKSDFICLFVLFVSVREEKLFVFCSKSENPELYLIDYFLISKQHKPKRNRLNDVP